MNLLDRYEEIVGRREVERLRRLAGRLAGKRDGARQLDAERRRRGRNPRLDDAADAGIGDRRPLGSGHRPTRLLPRHQGLPQRLAGTARGAEEGRFRPPLRGQPGECPAAESPGRLRLRPRSAADLPAAVHAHRAGRPLGLALPHRRLAAASRGMEVPGKAPDAITMRRSSRWPPSPARWAAQCSSIPPSIDPLSDKNCPIPEAERLETLARWGIDPEAARCWSRSRGSIASKTLWASSRPMGC